jgi:FSR family fosmidomycin resistance protein-like MFS transporter
VYAIGVFAGLAHRGTINFLPLHFSKEIEWSIDPVTIGGLLTALVLFSGIVGQAFGGVIGDRYSRRKLMVFVLLVNIPFLLLISTTSGYLLIFMAMLWAVANFAYQPITNAFISDLSSPANRGTLFGIFHGLSFGVGAFASTLAGYIGDRWDTHNIFLAMAVILLPAIMLALRLAYPKSE